MSRLQAMHVHFLDVLPSMDLDGNDETPKYPVMPSCRYGH
jgi:hypothetical protein